MQKLIERGNVSVNEMVLDRNKRIKRGDRVTVEFIAEKMSVDAEEMPLEVVFENTDFAVINKDAGINVHPTGGEWGKTGTLVNALLHHFGNLSVIN